MKYFLACITILSSTFLYAQDADLLLNHDLYHYIDRIDIKGYTNQVIHTDIKPYAREHMGPLLLAVPSEELTPVEKGWHERMLNLVSDSMANVDLHKGLWNTFYTNHRDFYHFASSGNNDVELYINPVLHVSGGLTSHEYPDFRSPIPLTYNSRGVSIRLKLFEKVGIYTEVFDNLNRTPVFIYRHFLERDVLPGEEFIKTFGDENTLDYFSSRAYLTFSPVKPFRIKFGKDRAFWGNGFQSLSLSDHAANYLMLQLNTRIWKLELTNLFTQMIDFIPNKSDDEGTFPRKYAVFHQLSYKPNPRLSFSVYESIVYTPQLANGSRGFELQYLNPIIFYRSTEQALGSPDNAFIGFSVKANVGKTAQLYGQVLIDDYNFSKRREGSGFWGNKLGYQIGAKYIDILNVPTLDLQLEYNRVRPYTYQHFNVAANFTHYGQVLGHAAGANLNDVTALLRYHPIPALNIVLIYSQIEQGLDENDINYGGDPARSFAVNRARDFDNTVGQGVSLSIKHLRGRVTYQLFKTDIYAEIEGRLRLENDIRTISLLGGIRMGIPTRPVKF